jgi:DNA primase
MEIKDGNSEGEIIIPSSLDAAETALIAATLETIERVGPCTAEIKLLAVEDTRSDKRKFVVDKAKEILKGLSDAGIPNVDEVSEQIKAAVRTDEITNYKGSPCGPNLLDSENIVIVEGRADVVNLLRYGIRNTIAIEGTSVPQAVSDLTKEKSATVFVDGDRGGELIIKELSLKADIDFVTSAPRGKEVEELTQKEVFKALREKIPLDNYKKEGWSASRQSNGAMETSTTPAAPTETEAPVRKYETRTTVPSHRSSRYEERPRRDRYERRGRESRDRSRERVRDGGLFSKMGFGSHRVEEEKPVRLTIKQKEEFGKILDELVGTRAACVLDEKGNMLGRVPVSEIENTIRSMENAHAVVFDGRVTNSIAYAAKSRGIKVLVGTEKEASTYGVAILDKKELEK